MTVGAPTAALARSLVVVAPLGAAAIGLTSSNMVWGGAAWLVFLLAVLAGWGHLLARAVRAVGGMLLAIGQLDRAAPRGSSRSTSSATRGATP